MKTLNLFLRSDRFSINGRFDKLKPRLNIMERFAQPDEEISARLQLIVEFGRQLLFRVVFKIDHDIAAENNVILLIRMGKRMHEIELVEPDHAFELIGHSDIYRPQAS